MDATTDRRARRSRRALISAMEELLRERPFEEITVQLLIDRADVGRATFYAHFRGKLDVVDALASEVFEGLHGEAGDDELRADTAGLPLRGLFRRAAERSDQLRAMLSAPAADVFWGRSTAMLAATLEEQLRTLPPRFDLHRGVPTEVRARFVAGAVEGTLRWWVGAGLPYPPERMAAMVAELLPAHDARAGG